MKIRREKLEKMVRDEVQKVLDEVNPGHDEDGRFAAKGKGKTYSLTKNAEDDVADDDDVAPTAPVKTPEPAAKPSSQRAEDILAMIRNRQKQ